MRVPIADAVSAFGIEVVGDELIVGIRAHRRVVGRVVEGEAEFTEAGWLSMPDSVIVVPADADAPLQEEAPKAAVSRLSRSRKKSSPLAELQAVFTATKTSD